MQNQPVVYCVSKNYRKEISERLNKAFDNVAPQGRGRAAEIARIFEVTNRTAAKWINGDEIPDVTRFPDISEKTGVRVGWIMDGDGDMYESYSGAINEEAFEMAFTVVDEVLNELGRNATPMNKAQIAKEIYRYLLSHPEATANGLKEIVTFRLSQISESS